MAGRGGLLGSELGIFKRNGWKDMLDGGVSHSSKIKLPTFRTVLVQDLFSYLVFLFLSHYFNIMFCV
jgi:hypothetical protein